MPLHPKGPKREAKMNKGAAEQYDRGNEVPSTWKQKSSLDNNRMASLWNVTHSAFSKIRGVLGAPRIGINSNKWTSCQISPLNHILQLKNLMSKLPHLSPSPPYWNPGHDPVGQTRDRGSISTGIPDPSSSLTAEHTYRNKDRKQSRLRT